MATIIFGIVCLLGGIWAAIAIPSSDLFGAVVVKGSGLGKKIALTFDDGPNPAATQAILTILEQYHAKATFFMLGYNVQRAPAVAEAVAAAGHEIGVHSWDHSPKLILWPPPVQYNDLQETKAVITKATGIVPTVFRPPWGRKTPFLLQRAKALQLQTVNWSVDGVDWYVNFYPKRFRPTVAKVVKNVTKKTKPGDIVLLHDGKDIQNDSREITIAALPHILEYFAEKGYETVTVSELLAEAQTLNASVSNSK